jgi:D-xylose transport system permease protein
MKNFMAALWQSTNKRVLFMVALLAIIWTVFHFWSGQWTGQGYVLTAGNMSNLSRQVAVVALLSVAMTLVIASNNIDLSVGSALGMFGAITAALITQQSHNPFLAVIFILGVGFAIGALHGALIHYINIPSFVVTLGGLIAYRGVTQWVARESIPMRVPWIKAMAAQAMPQWLAYALGAVAILALLFSMADKRRSQQRAGLQSSPLGIDILKIIIFAGMIIAILFILSLHEGVPIEFVILIGAAVLLSFVARNTRFGRYVYAVGGNKQAALYSGVPIARTIILTFGLMGLLAATAGILTMSELAAASPDMGELKELEAIAACVIGGASLSGGIGVIGMSVLGALVMASIKNGMSMVGIAAQMQKVILGSVLVIAVGLDQWSRRTKK